MPPGTWAGLRAAAGKPVAPRYVQTAAGTAGSTSAHRDVVFDGQASKGVQFGNLCSSRERWGYLGRPRDSNAHHDAEAAERHAHLVVDVPVPGPLLQLWVCSGCAGLACWVSEGPRALRGGPFLAQRWELPARAGGSYLRHDQDRDQDKSTGHLPGSWIALGLFLVCCGICCFLYRVPGSTDKHVQCTQHGGAGAPCTLPRSGTAGSRCHQTWLQTLLQLAPTEQAHSQPSNEGTPSKFANIMMMAKQQHS